MLAAFAVWAACWAVTANVPAGSVAWHVFGSVAYIPMFVLAVLIVSAPVVLVVACGVGLAALVAACRRRHAV